MLPRGSIAATHVWKRFRADPKQRKLLRDRVQHLGNRLRGRGRRGWRWALRDVDVVVDPGGAVGLVGANGSGKTTMLKILARVMYPFAGRVTVSGRVGALIEVRAGIHPDLTGRENVLLQGSLLGLHRKEVILRFDDIVAFAELEDAIDRQVKFYSSGMQTRLGFAIAAFLQPDILLVDEVLAVGDGAFQQKCLDRMREVLNQGTTVIFVSHDLAAVEALCSKGIWLRQGLVQADGPVQDVLGEYRHLIEQAAEIDEEAEGIIRMEKVEVIASDGGSPRTQGPMEVRAVMDSPDSRPGTFYLGVSEGPAGFVFVVSRGVSLSPGETEVRCWIPRLPLPRGRFYVWLGVFSDGKEVLAWHPRAMFDVLGPDLDPGPRAVVRLAPVHVEASWAVARR